MSQFFLNPWLLLGLAGVALPVIAHLLSRRRFDIVEWGAMQFLNPSRKTRRRLKLEELLLLLLRIGLVVALVLAATRPWIPGGWLGGYRSSGSRTVVLVIDGSNSMARSDGANSVQQQAIRRAAEFLATLGPDDNVALIDARDQPRAVIESPLRDLRVVEEQLRKLPSPGGACDMLAAVEKSLAILGRSSQAAREVVVFTDSQAIGWKPQSDADWARYDDVLKFPAVRPNVWVVDVTAAMAPVAGNVSVGRIELSRDMTVPDFPLHFRANIRNNSDADRSVPVRLLLDGQALAGESQTVAIPARGEVTVEFDHAIRAAGTRIVTIEADPTADALPVDNRSHAAVRVDEALPVLLVNGVPSAVASRRDSFFAELAFAPPEGRPPWVKATVVDATDLKPADFNAQAAVVLCNVGELSSECRAALQAFVTRGGGVVSDCGPRTTPDSFAALFGETGLLPGLEMTRVREAPPHANEVIRIAPLTIQPGWLDRFRADPARTFLKATFESWCVTKSQPPVVTDMPETEGVASSVPVSPGASVSAPVVLAQLSTGDPLLYEARHGDGVVLLLTTTLSRNWTDLPARSDYVPFLYEAVFHAASAKNRRNVSFGEPLIARVTVSGAAAMEQAGDSPPASEGWQWEFEAPGGGRETVPATVEGDAIQGVLAETFAPGVYRSRLRPDWARPDEKPEDAFAVNYDHSEDDLQPLTADDRARLISNKRLTFAASLTDLKQAMYGAESRLELWALLMAMFLISLVLELLVTRRAIRRGFGDQPAASAPA